MSKHLVIYHADCLDGHAAASMIMAMLKRQRVSLDDIEAKPCYYDDPLPDLTKKHVYIVDFSFPPEQLVTEAQKALSVRLIDHHASARKKWDQYMLTEEAQNYFRIEQNTEQTLVISRSDVGQFRGVFEAVFHMKMSGAVLAWRYTHVSAGDFLVQDNQTPLLLRYCQSYDLHTLTEPNTFEVAAALYAKPWIAEQNFEAFIDLMESIDDAEQIDEHGMLNALVAGGRTVLEYQTTLAKAMIRRGIRYVTVAGYRNIPVLAVPRELRTLIGGMLAKDVHFSLTYEDYGPLGIREYSFRSDKTQAAPVNVSLIAEHFGGGGHPNAAGVRTAIRNIWDE